MKRLLLALLLLLAPQAHAAIAHTGTAIIGQTTLANPGTASINAAVGSTVVVCSIWDDTQNITSATYGGNAMTASAQSGTGATGYRTKGFYLINPPTGAQTLSVTYGGVPTSGWYTCTAYSGVTAVDDVQVGADTGTKLSTMSINVTTASTGDWIACTYGGNLAATSLSTNMNIQRVSGVSAFELADSNGTLGAPGTYAGAFTASPADWWYGGVCYALSSASASTPTSDPGSFWGLMIGR